MHCPYCDSGMDLPRGEPILVDEFIQGIDVDVSAQQHVQLSCPHCDVVLGYLGVGAAAGSPDVRGYY